MQPESNQLVDLEDIFTSQNQQGETQRAKIMKIKKNFKKKALENKVYDQEEKDDKIGDYISPEMQSIYVKTFGCSHNVSDSEFMMGQLVAYGYNLVEDPLKADVILINSCTVKNPSQEALLRLVTDSKEIKKPVVVSGCVPQGDRFIEGLQDVSIIGVTQIDRVVEVVEETLKGNSVQLLEKKALPSLDLPKIRKNKFIEIIPINTGCLGNCTYCKTKHARGHLGSYQPQLILERMLQACQEGVKEIWLTSEDTGAYGRDIHTDIVQLLVLLVKALPEDVMLRIGMTNPPYIKEHLKEIAVIMNHPQVFSFLHIPIQSGSNNVLDRMNREYTVEDFELVCDVLISNVKEMMISTDIICGFPGETDEDHEGTMQVIDKYRIPIVNISQFYARPGTVAQKMKQVTTKEKKSRSRAVTQLFNSYKNYHHMADRQERVIISEVEHSNKHYKNSIMIAHTKNYTKIVIDSYDPDLMGKQVLVKITKTNTWHCDAEIIDRNPPFQKVDNKEFFKGVQQVIDKREEARRVKLEEIRQRKIDRENRLKEQVRQLQEKSKGQQDQGEQGQSHGQEGNDKGIGTGQIQEVDQKTDLELEKRNRVVMCGVAAGLIGLGILSFICGY